MNSSARVVCGILALCATASQSAGTWCLGFDHLGPLRAGMSVEEVLRLADFSGMERAQPADQCWYLRYDQSQRHGAASGVAWSKARLRGSP